MTDKRRGKFIRDPGKTTFQMTDRDVEILKALNRYRYMRTGQIHSLLFPNTETKQPAARRLRNLYHHQFVSRATPYVKLGQPMPEIAYYLGRKGRALLRDQGVVVKYYRKSSEIKYQFLNHALAISEFRVALERAVEDLDNLILDRFIPDFEMKKEASAYAGRRRYLLCTEITHPAYQKTFIVHPDALIKIDLRKDEKSAPLLLFLEVDQGTEGMERIRDKMTGYMLAIRQGIFRHYGGDAPVLVLFQAHNEKRAQVIFEALADHAGSAFVRVTHADQVKPDNLFFEKIWRRADGAYVSLYRPINGKHSAAR